MKIHKKICAIIMSIIMVITCLPTVIVSASSSGTAGDSITYTLDDDGVLTVSGTGDMTNYTSGSKVPWYSERTSVVSVIIENGVTSIGKYAFYYCTNLKSVSIPDSVKSIGYNAFCGCSSLNSITLPDSITSIGNSVFSQCTSLNSITLPENITSIPNCMFDGCSSLNSVTLPESITSIGLSAFNQCTSLSSITIPESVTSIGTEAFFECSGLSSIILPANLTIIDDWTFGGCTSLTDITIPNSVTSIGDYAFCNCTGLESIVIPNSVTSIGNYAFYICEALSSITIPDSITSIGYYAFYGCISLSSLTLPKNLTNIDYYTFYGCTGLKSIIFPDNLSDIGFRAFEACSGLSSITIPDSVINISDGAFYNCTGLSSITIPNSEICIGESAFFNCAVSTAGPVGGGYDYEFGWTKTIPSNAFSYCRALSSVKIPESITVIEYNAFSNCTGLSGITIPESVTTIGYCAFCNCTGLTDIIIPDNVTSIEGYAFSNCTGLKSLTIPESAVNIGEGAFCDCAFSTAGPVGGGYEYEFGWTDTIPDYAFYGCKKLSLIDIPDSVESIGYSAFSNCTGLSSITLPDGITAISDLAFNYCPNLSSIIIPNGVKTINYCIFGGCSSLSNVTLPKSLTAIGNSAFYGCSGLSSITIPESVESINSSAFSKSGLTEVYCYEGSAADDSSLYPDGVTIYYLSEDSETEDSASSSYISGFELPYAEGDLIYSDSNLDVYAAQTLTGNSNYLTTSSTNTVFKDSDGTSYSGFRLVVKVVPSVTGNITADLYSALGSSKSMYIMKYLSGSGTNDDPMTGSITAKADSGSTSITGFIEAGNVYYIVFAGTNAKLSSISFEPGDEPASTTESTTEATTETTTVDLVNINDIERAAPGTASDGGSHTLWLVGDSTGCYYNETGRIINRNGFGMALGDDAANYYTAEYKIFDNENLEVRNLAVSGTSSLSYLSSNNYTTLTQSWQKGDYLIIAFGHNDEKSTDSRFTDASMGAEGWNSEGQFAYSLYANYILPAVEAGVTPVLATPIVRRSTSSSGPTGSNVHNLTSSGIGDYRQTIIDLGTKFGVSVIDNTYNTYTELITLGAGDCTISDDNTSCETTGYAKYHSVQTTGIDNTHTGELGARMIAYFMGQIIKGNEIEFGITGGGSSAITSILTDGSADNGGVFDSLSTFFGADANIDPRLTKVTLTGSITNKVTDNAAAYVESITFTDMTDSSVSYTTTDIDTAFGTYSINIYTGEYNTSVVTTDGSVTYDRVSVTSNGENVNEIYLESTAAEASFVSELSVPGDYDTLTDAITAINSMTDRPDGEEGRLTITLTADLQEQVRMDADYVTLDGQGYEINWYYGVGSAYYSVDSDGYYSETLFRDKYSKENSRGTFWGGTMIVSGDYFLAQDVTFRNTYNYYVTEKEIEDGVTPTDGKNERTLDTDVETSTMRERANALYTKGNYCEYKNCNILSSQCTMGVNGSLSNYTYFTNCTIGGNVDIICGAGTMLFDNCTLQWKTEDSSCLGYIATAKSKPYIFRSCTITQDGNKYKEDSKGYYGRPWATDAYAVYYKCETNDLIGYNGWYDMSSFSADDAEYYEYNNLASDGSVFMSTRGKDLNDEEYEDILTATEGNNIIEGMLGGWTPVYYSYNSDSDDDMETTTETTTEAECPYSFIIDRDLDVSDTYAAGDTVYSDSYITYEAELKLSVNESSASNKIGSYSYTNSLVCSSTNTSVTLDGTAKSRRIHSSIKAKQDCIVTIATTVPSGKEIAVAEKNSNGTYTSLAYYDGSVSYGNVEIVLNLSAGQTVYIMGQTANPQIYAVDATSAGDADGNHTVDIADTIKIMQYISSSAALTEAEFAAADINGDGIVDRKDAALALKQLISKLCL